MFSRLSLTKSLSHAAAPVPKPALLTRSIVSSHATLLRLLSTTSIQSDFGRSDSFQSRQSFARPHQSFSKGPRDAGVVSDFSSLKSPFSHTDSPTLDWADVDGLTPQLKRAMAEEFKYKSCTPVQAAIASKIPLTNDLVVQAKTGTGKTLAFLIPAVNRILMSENLQSSGPLIKILIVSPTRELAQQIGKEAQRLVSKCRLGVHTLVGGESKHRQAQDMSRRRCDIIVGTPGRLLDFIKSDRHFRDSLKGVESFILDEADRMLEIGFKDDIVDISNELPSTRHTMLFSATYPKNVDQLVKSTLKPGFEVINTISDDDVSTVHTIAQSYLIAPLSEQPMLLHSALSRAMKAGAPFKAIVFFPTTRSVELYSEMFRNLSRVSVPGSTTIPFNALFELHSRKAQNQRVRIADRFRAARSGVLFTSDVSARGVDYPGIHLVVQMGMPMTRDNYVHRIGRTGRAGKSGTALTILSPFEKAFFDGLSELPIHPAKRGENGELLTGLGDSLAWDEQANREAVNIAMKELDQAQLGDAFIGNLGFYQGQVDTMRGSGYTAHQAMQEMQEFYQSMGLEHVPNLPSALRGTFAPRASRSDSYSGSRNSSRFGSFNRRDGNSRDSGRNSYSRDFDGNKSRGFDSNRGSSNRRYSGSY